MQPARPKIFLSYASEDLWRVEPIYERLINEGFESWMDKRDIVAGENWEKSIWRAVRSADFFLTCITRRSLTKRGFLQKELKRALSIWEEKLDDDICLIPCRLENCTVSGPISDLQWVDLFEVNGWDQLLAALNVGLERQSRTFPVRADSPGHNVVDQQITDSGPQGLIYQSEVSYPTIEPENQPWVAEINQVLRGWAINAILDFRKQSLGTDLSVDPLDSRRGLLPERDELSTSYSVRLLTNQLLSLEVSVSTFGAGAAHPNHGTSALNYFLEPAMPLELHDLFDPNEEYADLLAELCFKGLQEQSHSEGEWDPLWIGGPDDIKVDHLSTFLLGPQDVTFVFDPYLVGPYAWGTREVPIRYADIRSIVNMQGPLQQLLAVEGL